MGLEPLELGTQNQKRSADSREMAGRPGTPRQHATSVTKNLTRPPGIFERPTAQSHYGIRIPLDSLAPERLRLLREPRVPKADPILR